MFNKEIKTMCADNTNSILRSNDLELFSWDKVMQEAKVYAPILCSLLEVCIPDDICMRGYLVALLCHLRWNHMNLHLKIISCILYSGHCSKQVT